MGSILKANSPNRQATVPNVSSSTHYPLAALWLASGLLRAVFGTKVQDYNPSTGTWAVVATSTLSSTGEVAISGAGAVGRVYGNGNKIAVAVISPDGSTETTVDITDGLSTFYPNGLFYTSNAPAICWAGDHWVVLWVANDTFSGYHIIALADVPASGGSFSNVRVLVPLRPSAQDQYARANALCYHPVDHAIYAAFVDVVFSGSGTLGYLYAVGVCKEGESPDYSLRTYDLSSNDYPNAIAIHPDHNAANKVYVMYEDPDQAAFDNVILGLPIWERNGFEDWSLVATLGTPGSEENVTLDFAVDSLGTIVAGFIDGENGDIIQDYEDFYTPTQILYGPWVIAQGVRGGVVGSRIGMNHGLCSNPAHGAKRVRIAQVRTGQTFDRLCVYWSESPVYYDFDDGAGTIGTLPDCGITNIRPQTNCFLVLPSCLPKPLASAYVLDQNASKGWLLWQSTNEPWSVMCALALDPILHQGAVLFGDDNGYVNQMLSGFTDLASAVTVRWPTAELDMGDVSVVKRFRHIGFRAVTVGAGLTIGWSVDGGRRSGSLGPLTTSGHHVLSLPDSAVGRSIVLTFSETGSVAGPGVEGISLTWRPMRQLFSRRPN